MATIFRKGKRDDPHRMNLHTFYEVAANAERKSREGWTTFQQFNCAECNTKQTMPDANVFHKKGRCERCNGITDIGKDGCNFMAVMSAPSDKTAEILSNWSKEPQK